MYAQGQQDIQKRLKQPLTEALGSAITDLLKPSDYEHLSTIASMRDGGTRLFHVIKWLRAIHENRALHQGSDTALAEPERWFIKVISQYRGNINLLKNFCTLLECPDPILAARTAQLHLPGSRELPSQLVAQVPDLRSPNKNLQRNAVRGASGQMLVGDVYWAENKNAPGSLGFFAGIRATLRILETFGGERHQVAKLEEIKVRRDNSLRDEFRKALTLDDLLNNPRLEKILGSPLLTRKLEVYKQLEPLAAQVRSDINMALYANSVFGLAARQSELADDPGGQLRGWFSKQVSLPEIVSSAVAQYYDPHLDHSPEKEQALAKILVSYYRANVLVSDQVIVAPIRRDLEALRRLPSDDPLRLRFDQLIADAWPFIDSQLNDKSGVLSLTQVSALLQAAPLDELRFELNKIVYSHFEQEILRARSRVRKLFSDGRTWSEDLYRDAIPLARLRETEYGQALINGDSVLGYRDFEAIKRMLVATILVPDKNNFLRSLDAVEFRQLVESFLKASRKLTHYDEILRIKRRNQLPQFEPVVRRDLELAEKFVAALPYSEVIARVADRKMWPSRYRAKAKAISSEARAGLISPSGLQVAKQCTASVSKLSPRRDQRELIAAAKKVVASPLVEPIWSKLSDVAGYQYLTPDEIKALKLIADSSHVVDQVFADGDVATAEKRLEHLTTYKYIGVSDFAGRFSLVRRNFRSIHPPLRTEALDIYAPAAIDVAFNAVKAEYVKVSKLAPQQQAAIARLLGSELGARDCVAKSALAALQERGIT